MNRLRWHLLELCPELERSITRKAFHQAHVLDRVDRRLRKLNAGARARIARDQLTQVLALNRQIDALHSELTELVKAHRPRLLTEQGCSALTAAVLTGHTAGNQQFHSEAAFAPQTGTAPIPCSSSKQTQHRLNRGGDGQLNHALHIIAVTRAQRDPATKQYLARKKPKAQPPRAPYVLSSDTSRGTSISCSQSRRPSQQPAAEPEQPAKLKPSAIPARPRPQREVDRSDAPPHLMVCVS